MAAVTTIRRKPERGRYDAATIHAILDEALYCHVGFIDGGRPVVIPTIHARRGDVLYLHGSPASRMLRTLARGSQVCVTVTILDGLVAARSFFNSSMNYRSVVLFGMTRAVDDPAEKAAALQAISEHVFPGRWDEARRPNDRETRATAVVAIPIAAASAKVRTGPPEDEDEDYALEVWAGVVPMRLRAGEPVPDPALDDAVPVPRHLADYGRR